MTRGLIILACVITGLTLLVFGLLVPAHLRAVDVDVLKVAGRRTPSLVQEGMALVREMRVGPGELLSAAANDLRFPDRAILTNAVKELEARQPALLAWGMPDMRARTLLWADPKLSNSVPQPVTEVVLRVENRGKLLAYLNASTKYEMRELLGTRALTNTVLIPPSTSAAGQAFDAAVSVCGLLLDAGHLHPAFRKALSQAVVEAARDGKSEPCEQALLDLLLLGQRLNYGQLAHFVARVETLQGLRLLANAARQAGKDFPTLYAAVLLSGQPAEVAQHLMDFSHSGKADLAASLRYHAGGIKELLARRQRLHASVWRQDLGRRVPFDSLLAKSSEYALVLPWVAMGLKWVCYLAGGFLLALAGHFLRPAVPNLERPLQVRGFHLAREILFALGFLVFMLLVSEPFLAQDDQKAELPFRLRLPMVSTAAATAAKTNDLSSLMNQLSLLTLLLFFVLQALIYVACLLKLAEIRRQNVGPRIKLKLLDNEDHLFDAGLYLGFVGTIISLILVSLGVIKPSLMAAYSSTSFGIIFVSIFKIFNLRPLRRKLLLESEQALEPSVDAATATALPTGT